MLIQTKQGTLLFKTLTQLGKPPASVGSAKDAEASGASLLELRPLTLIVPLAKEAKSASVGDVTAASRIYQSGPLAIIVAQEAEIQFQKAPNFTSGSAPPITGGLLRGPIQITGIDPRKGYAPQWVLNTSNLRIEGRRVWTNSDVEVQIGNSVASGKDLSIFLKQDLLGANEHNDGPWGILDRMELLYVKQVSCELPPGGLWKDLKLGNPERVQRFANSPARIELRL